MNEIKKSNSDAHNIEKPIQKKDVLLRIANQLENIASDTNKTTDVSKLVKQLKAIVLKIYKYIDEQSKNNIVINHSNINVIHNEIHNEIHKQEEKKPDSLLNVNNIKSPKPVYSISSQFHLYFNANTSKIIIVNHKTAEYKFGKYEGEFKNGIMDGKGTMTYNNKFEYIKEKAKENISIHQVKICTKVISNVIKPKEKELLYIITVINTKAIIKIGIRKEKEYIIIIMEINMKEISKMTFLKDLAFILTKTETNILENLNPEFLKDLVYIIIISEKRTVIDMKEKSKIGTKKEKVFIIIIMETYMKETLKMILKKEKGFTIIKMEIEKWEII